MKNDNIKCKMPKYQPVCIKAILYFALLFLFLFLLFAFFAGRTILFV
jgi:hypothetical protein